MPFIVKWFKPHSRDDKRVLTYMRIRRLRNNYKISRGRSHENSRENKCCLKSGVDGNVSN